MKIGNCFAGVLLMAGFVGGSALAAGDDTTVTGASTTERAPAKAKHRASQTKAAAGGTLARCIQENTTVAETFCQTHPDQCAAEKSGVRSECEAEIRGQRHSG